MMKSCDRYAHVGCGFLIFNFLAVQQGHDRITGKLKEKQKKEVSRAIVLFAPVSFLNHLFIGEE